MLDEYGNVVPEWMVVAGKVLTGILYTAMGAFGFWVCFTYIRAIVRMIKNGEGAMDALVRPSKAQPIDTHRSVTRPATPVSAAS